MRPGQQSPRKHPIALAVPFQWPRFNEAGATIAPETCRVWPFVVFAYHTRFNEAGATIAPETPDPARSSSRSAHASMRPGQQSPRKPSAARKAGSVTWCFNEAGATIAPETRGSSEGASESACFNEAGATIAPETRNVRLLKYSAPTLQ